MRSIRLAFDPERGPGLGAVAFSLLGHLVAALAIAVLARSDGRTVPHERTLSVRLVPGPATAVTTPRARQAPRPRTERSPPAPKVPPVERPDAPARVMPDQAPEPPPEPHAAGPREDRPPQPQPKRPPKSTARTPPAAPPEAASAPEPPDASETPGTVGGAPGPGLAARVGEGESPGDEYLSRLVARVSASWVKPRTGLPSRPAVVLFEMTRLGRVSSAVIESSSGSALYDRAALRAVQVAVPLPPLPPAYATATLKVHFEFIP